MEKYLLEVQNLSKSFYQQEVLKNININLKPGEIHAIIGENGSGKSTLMKILSGVFKKDGGDIYIEGKKVNIDSPGQATKLGISMIFQESMLVPSMSVIENIFLGRYEVRKPKWLSVINWKPAVKEAIKIFKNLNYNINIYDEVSTLAAAEKKMVEVAKALCSKSKIIILDEVTIGLNELERESLFKEIKRIKKMGVGIFFISQNINDVLSIADTITILKEGKEVITCATKDMDKSSIVSKIAENNSLQGYPKIKNKIGEEILRVDNISNDNILKDIKFTLHKGEILGLTGFAGSGRSSIARCIFGMDQTMSGKLYINNKEVNIKSPKDAVKLRIGYVKDDNDDDIIYSMTMAENITLSHLKGVTVNQVIDIPLEKKIVDYYINRLGIKGKEASDPVRYLSGGNKQKVALAKWLFSNSKIIIFDDPTNKLDVSSKVEIYNLMSELVLKGISILFISSNFNELIGMCDRILVMNKGRITKELKGSDMTRMNIIEFCGRD